MLGFFKLTKHTETDNVMLKNDKGDLLFVNQEDFVSSPPPPFFFSLLKFLSLILVLVFIFSPAPFLWFFPTFGSFFSFGSFLTAKSLKIKHVILHYMPKMTGWGCSELPQKCPAHSSLKLVRVVLSIQACTELGL